MQINVRGDRRRRFLLPAVLAAGALLAVSCGDDDGGDTATTAGEATTTAGETAGATSTSSGAAAGGGGSEGAAAAAEVVAEFSERPTTFDIPPPIEGEIPTGKTVYFISCGAETCELEPPIIKQATDLLGWELVTLSTDGSPQQIQNAWEQVVREQPDGVIYTATPRSQIEQYITQATANGTSIAACCITDPAEDGIVWTSSTPEQTGELGRIIAAWVVTDAAENGNDTPGALYLDLPDFPILSSLATEFESSFTEFCPDCQHEQLDIGLSSIQQAPDQVVSLLRSNPDIKYVITSTDGAFIGLPAALSAAGLNDIKIFGEGPATANLKNIADGAQAGSMAFAFYEILFGAVDAIARNEMGLEVPEGFAPPNWILTQENLPSSTEFFPVVPDVVDQYREVWGK